MHQRARSPVTLHRAWTEKRSLRPWLKKGTAALLLFVFTTVILHGNWPVALTWMSGGLGLWVLWDVIQRRRGRAAVLQEADTANAEAFVHYAAALLGAQGYVVQKPTRPLDHRVDLLLMRGKEHVACRLQQQAEIVDTQTVIETLAGMEAQGCERALVLTTHFFTRSARALADRKGCILIDREGLADLVLQYRQGHRVLLFPREREVGGLRRRK